MKFYGKWNNNVLISVEEYNFDPKIKVIIGEYTEITEYRFNQFIAEMPEIPDPIIAERLEYAALTTDKARIEFLARRGDLIK